MKKCLTISEVVRSGNCTSCGLCVNNNLGTMEMEKGIYVPFFEKPLSKEKDKELVNICPGRGYDIVSLGEKRFIETTYNYKLGNYKSIGAARTNDTVLLNKSTSGGMMPAVANYLLDKKHVEGILTVKFVYTDKGPVPKPFIAKTKEELIEAQGSKYMPIPLLKNLDEILSFSGSIAIIGTPCQIAGVRLLQEKNPLLNEKIKLAIANFCGGYRDYRETERIFQINNINKNNINFFSYRGKGQPGYMTVESNEKETVDLPYPDYGRLTGYIKHSRCRLCVDATGELADLSFGDAWIDRFLKTKYKWSFYISRSTFGEKVLKEMLEDGLFKYEEISVDELVKSQRGNLTTKKERQNSRYQLYKRLGYKIPSFDGGYNKKNLNIKLELKVFISQRVMYLFEKIRLYLTIAKLIKRV
jgi:coenzyme F420 hydrogenase subunit beta